MGILTGDYQEYFGSSPADCGQIQGNIPRNGHGSGHGESLPWRFYQNWEAEITWLDKKVQGSTESERNIS